MLKNKLLMLAAASVVLLSACGAGLNGTYGSDMASYTFKRDGTVVVDSFGSKVELKYEVDGKDVRISTPQGVLILTRVDDDTIQGPMGVKLTKHK